MRDIIGILPEFKNNQQLIASRQLTGDIIREIDKMHHNEKKNYSKIAEQFWTGDVLSTCQNLYNYLRKNITYREEPGAKQTVKTASAFLNQGYGDCKHYSSFVAGVIDALSDMGYPVSVKLAYVNSVDNSENYHHVFPVVTDTETGREIFVDAIDGKHFDDRRTKYKRVKYSDMALYRISGEVGRRAKKTKAERKQARQENKAARKANRQERRAERQRVRAMPKEQRKEYKKQRRQEQKNIRKSLTGVQKTMHVLMKVPNAVSRNAFLGLLKINAFRMASKLGAKIASDASFKAELQKQWSVAGGNWGPLKQAINQGIKVHNARFKENIPGIGASGPEFYVNVPLEQLVQPWAYPVCNCDTYDEMQDRIDTALPAVGDGGAASGPAAVAALVVAAMPLILKLLSLLKRSGVDTDEVQESGADATDEVMDEYNDAQDYPVEEDSDERYGKEPVPQFGVRAYNDKNGTATVEYTKTNLDDNGDVRYSDSGIDATIDRIKYWVEDNKSTLIWVGVGALGLLYGPRILSNVLPKKRRR